MLKLFLLYPGLQLFLLFFISQARAAFPSSGIFNYLF